MQIDLWDKVLSVNIQLFVTEIKQLVFITNLSIKTQYKTLRNVLRSLRFLKLQPSLNKINLIKGFKLSKKCFSCEITYSACWYHQPPKVTRCVTLNIIFHAFPIHWKIIIYLIIINNNWLGMIKKQKYSLKILNKWKLYDCYDLRKAVCILV